MFTISTLLNLFAIITLVSASAIPHTMAGNQSVSWGYTKPGQSNQWGRLSPAFAICETGKHQSPIDINSFEVKPISGRFSAQIQFDYHSVPLEILNNGHNIQVNYPQGSSVNIDNQQYELVQFHFHTPSEHTFDGHAYPMEIHLVHQNSLGRYAVISLMIEAGQENSLIKTIWEDLPETGLVKTRKDISINVDSFLPTNQAYYSYQGSLTTPPCDENVDWYVMTETTEASPKQIEQFSSVYNINARAVQPLNNRLVKLIP